jgi:phospholipid/cholesterol/gamma-HCH transport system permease protein
LNAGQFFPSASGPPLNEDVSRVLGGCDPPKPLNNPPDVSFLCLFAYDPRMPFDAVENLGRTVNQTVADFGDFSIFCWRVFGWIFRSAFRWKNLRLLMPQFYEIGVKSVPVVAIVGAFIGMVMSVETYAQFKGIGQEARLGGVIALSVVKQIGPVMAAMMIAGRVGGSLTAELGTMNVTEQLDALRVMGSDPISYLVVPRFLACILLTPLLTVYSDILGIAGGWFIGVATYHIPNGLYIQNMVNEVEIWQVMEGVIKSIFFGAAIGLIACYRGFNCGSGASGVGRACTESFVQSFLAIITINLVFASVARQVYNALFGNASVFG